MNYIEFNVLEGLFWIVLGIACAMLSLFLPSRFKRLAVFSSITLVLFGMSDFAEVLWGSFFEPGMMWLFVWKVVCVVGLVFMIIWYLWIRIFQMRSKK